MIEQSGVDLNDNMDLAEDFIQYVIKYTMDKCPELKFLETRLLDEEKSKPVAEAKWRFGQIKLCFENNFKRVSYRSN
jgi:asparaginyl-tRNA synthetase